MRTHVPSRHADASPYLLLLVHIFHDALGLEHLQSNNTMRHLSGLASQPAAAAAGGSARTGANRRSNRRSSGQTQAAPTMCQRAGDWLRHTAGHRPSGIGHPNACGGRSASSRRSSSPAGGSRAAAHHVKLVAAGGRQQRRQGQQQRCGGR